MKFFKITIEETNAETYYYETEAETPEAAHARAAYMVSNRKVFPPRRIEMRLHKRDIKVTECLESELEYGPRKKSGKKTTS